MQIRNRIKELRQVKASELLPNPRNWRRHPAGQADALRGALAEIGYADALIAYETDEGLMLIDGHLRAETTPDMEVPVLITDLDEGEANKLLMTLDPLAAMAATDNDMLRELLRVTEVDNLAMGNMLTAMQESTETLLPRTRGVWGVDSIEGTAKETVGYDVASVWPKDGDSETRVWDYLLPLPRKPGGKNGIDAFYSRSPAGEMERIVQTYMREGDYFLEVCAGWWTFSTAAALWGYSGEGIDIWDVSLRFAEKQLGQLPPGAGKVLRNEGDAADMPFEDNSFDFIYCNPPFFQLEKYSGDSRDLAQNTTRESWMKHSERMMSEMLRVVKPGCLVVTVMADYREKGALIALHDNWIAGAVKQGFVLHDLVIQALQSQQLRLWRHSYNAKRTAKAHEYVIAFKKPGGGDPDGLSPSPDDEAPLEETEESRG